MNVAIGSGTNPAGGTGIETVGAGVMTGTTVGSGSGPVAVAVVASAVPEVRVRAVDGAELAPDEEFGWAGGVATGVEPEVDAPDAGAELAGTGDAVPGDVKTVLVVASPESVSLSPIVTPARAMTGGGRLAFCFVTVGAVAEWEASVGVLPGCFV